MKYLIFLFLLCFPCAVQAEPIDYNNLVYTALTQCPRANPDRVDESILWILVDVERKYEVPENLRGMLLSAACSESGYNPKARGDRKFSKNGKPKAAGLFQMWSWWEREYKIDRTDPYGSANAFMLHVKRQLDRKRCKFKSAERRWIAAWVTAIRAPKKGGRCFEKPNHLRILRRWHKIIRRTIAER